MRLLIGMLCIIGLIPQVLAQETIVTRSIKSVGLFKNGVLAVQEEIQIPGSGEFILENVPEAVHGTFFLESDAVVETTVSTRNVKKPLNQNVGLDIQKDFVGKKVRVYSNETGASPVEGVITAISESTDKGKIINNQMPNSGLVLDTDTGRTYLFRPSVTRIDVDGKMDSVQRKCRVMLFHVKSEKPTVIRLFYLTHGLFWIPSYRIDISDPERLSVEQSAAVVNEWHELKNTDISLISGFPRIEYQHVRAPFSSSSSMNTFFQQLANRNHTPNSSILTQQMVMTNAIPSNLPVPYAIGNTSVTYGEGPDVYFHNIGKRDLAYGDTLFLSNGKATADYERVVEWSVPDSRDRFGRSTQENGDSEKQEAWDKLRFRNPLPFPMTTAPATVVSKGSFFGQNTSYWAAPGEVTKVPVTKSMNVRVYGLEYEKDMESSPKKFDSSNNRVYKYGSWYRKTTVNVELEISNNRAEKIKMLVDRCFSGEIVQTPDGATVFPLNEELNGPNRRQKIQWEFPLGAGETKKVTFSYTILIRD